MARPSSMARGAIMRRGGGGLSIVLAGWLAAPLPAAAQQTPHAESSQSVVEIKCPILVDGRKLQMRATGFAWHDSLHVVTALHSVVGCEGKPQVYSEQLRDGSPAEVVNAYQEADLALLRLEYDIGLEVVEHATSIPDIERRFYLYGYPLYARTMDGGPIAFKWGLGGQEITSLDRAFKSDDLTALFRNQTYPTPETQILKLQSPIVSGYSGSPIFDENGHVVAIVDGALLNGTVGANWSIPAYLYLPKLLNSDETPPTEVSSWAQELLKSSITDAEISDAPSALSPMAEDGESRFAAAAAGTLNLNLARKISLGRLQQTLDDYQLASYELNRNNLELFIGNPAQVGDIEFFIYEETTTGATFGLPAELYPDWNEASRTYVVATDSGRVVLEAAIEQWPSFEDAITEGKQSFVEYIAALADWDDGKTPADFELLNCTEDPQTGGCDPEWPWRQYSDVFTGTTQETGERVELTLTIDVSDTNLLALAIYNFGDFNEDLTEQDKISYLKLQTGLELLTDFSRH